MLICETSLNKTKNINNDMFLFFLLVLFRACIIQVAILVMTIEITAFV